MMNRATRGRAGGWLRLLAACGVVSCAAAPSPEVRDPSELEDGSGAPRPISLADGAFERVGEVDGVVVYEHPSSSVIRIGAEGRLPAPPDQVLSALLAYDRHAAVLSRVAESRVVEREGSSLLLYQHLSLPVVSDRDFTLRVTWGARGEERWIRYRAVSAGPAPKEGIVRVTRNSGGWDLAPIEGGRATLARYQSSLDLGGSLPTWMTQSGAVDELPSLFRSMCQLLPAPHAGGCSR